MCTMIILLFGFNLLFITHESSVPHLGQENPDNCSYENCDKITVFEIVCTYALLSVSFS